MWKKNRWMRPERVMALGFLALIVLGGRVTLRFFGYSQSGNRGVGCGLGNVLKTREGEPLSGGASAAADFAGIGNSVVPPVDPVTGRAINPITGQPM